MSFKSADVAYSNRREDDSFVEAIMPYYGELVNFFKNRAYPSDDPEDLAQETFSRLIKWAKNKNVDHPRKVLFKVARNLLIDHTRKRKKNPQTPIEAIEIDEQVVLDTTPSDTLINKEELDIVLKVIDNLPSRCKEVFTLNRLHGLTYSEIANKLSISKSTVEKHMIKGLLACKKAIDNN